MPDRKESADDYQVPHLGDDGEKVFASADELLAYLSRHPQYDHQIYWRSLRKDEIHSAIVAPTSDGGMVLGLSVYHDNMESARRQCETLKKFAGSPHAALLWDTPPPSTQAEFQRLLGCSL